MKGMKKRTERVVSIVLTFAMVMSLWVGISPMEIHAGGKHAIENKNIEIEKTGNNTYQINNANVEGWVYVELSDQILEPAEITVSECKEEYKRILSDFGDDEDDGINSGFFSSE